MRNKRAETAFAKMSLVTKVTVCSGFIALSGMALTSPAPAKNGAVEFAKYFNQLQKKGYLNESQDRVIKKRAFKPGEFPAAEFAMNKEIGLFATVSNYNADDAAIENLLACKEVNGLSVTLPWQMLEPSEEDFNWQPIDRLLALCAKHDKSLIVRVSTCGMEAGTGSGASQSDTPKWVFDGGAKSLAYTGLDGQTHQMPLFWDTSYLASWRNFIKAMGKRYDKNPALHSVGITGGGVLGGTAVIPAVGRSDGKTVDIAGQREIEQKLKKECGMNQRQIVEHWKYVSDIFPKYFENTRLNFDIDPPIAGRMGQDALDEISDYLIYRYGERVYLTRQNVNNAKHGFDQYRVLLKFRNDTLTGYQLTADMDQQALDKLVKNALDDGISFVEVPDSLLTVKDGSISSEPLKFLAAHVGYEVVTQKVTIPSEVFSGEPLKASFRFLNIGAAAPLRPSRNFDKDVASSYRVVVELRDKNDKPVVLSLHTPEKPTNKWLAWQPVIYDEELKMPKLPPGEYSVSMWLVDADTKRRIQILDAVTHEAPLPAFTVPVGKVKINPESSAIGASSTSPAQ